MIKYKCERGHEFTVHQVSAFADGSPICPNCGTSHTFKIDQDKLEVACWRILMYLKENGKSRKVKIRSNINIGEYLFDDAVNTLLEIGAIYSPKKDELDAITGSNSNLYAITGSNSNLLIPLRVFSRVKYDD